MNGNRALPEPKEEFLDDDFGNSIHYRTIAERQAAKARPKSARTSDGIPSPLATSFGVYTPDPYGSLSLPQTMPGLTGRTPSVHVFGSGHRPLFGRPHPADARQVALGEEGPLFEGVEGFEGTKAPTAFESASEPQGERSREGRLRSRAQGRASGRYPEGLSFRAETVTKN